MSSYDYLACHPCRTLVWVGQTSGACGFTFYSGEPKTMELLGQFLLTHKGHALEFTSEHNPSIDDYEDFEPPEQQEAPK